METFLLTDIEGSTALWERAPQAMHAAVDRHDRLLRETISRHRGQVYKATGDGVCARFDGLGDALAAAQSITQLLAAESWPTPEPLRIRIALASGEAAWRQADYYGPAVNLAARVLSLCRGGQTLLALASHDAGIEGAARMSITRHGHYRLKGIDEPVEVAELGVAGAIGPPPDGEKAYRVVRRDDLWVPLRDVRNNLAAERDAFVGREAELRALARHVDVSRLVTIVGPGGVGKTRLARRYAGAWLGDWPGGVYFCDLSEARTLEGVHFAVAVGLEVPLRPGDAAVQLGHAIAGRGRCLVILDNFEQVAEHGVATIGRWLDAAPSAHFVATSRERLHVAGEQPFALAPLNPESEGVALFELRARAHEATFALDANRDAVAHIARLLDGLPLAIELAAARARVLSPAQIVRRLEDRFALLAGRRGATTRQGTLRGAIDWSWALLSPPEQAALAQCAVFEGAFTLDAAEAVIALPADAPPAIDVVQALVDKSLLRADVPDASSRSDEGSPCFGMYLSIHDYARERLQALGEAARADVERRHGTYYARFGTDAAVQALSMHGGLARRKQLARDLDNLVTACRRAIARHDASTAAACFLAAWPVLEARGPFNVGVELGRGVASMDGLDARLQSRVSIAAARALGACGDVERADAAVEGALATARAAHDRDAEALALGQLAMNRHHAGRIVEALEDFRAAIAANDEAGNLMQRGAILANLANLQMEQGLMTEALRSYDQALALHRKSGNLAGEGIALGNLGTLHHELGDLGQARAAYERALEIHGDAGNLLQQAITRCNLGLLLVEQGEHEPAAAQYRSALAIHREIGNRRGEGVTLQQIGDMHLKLGELADAGSRYDEALAIHREVGNRRFEGGVLGSIGELRFRQRRDDEALQAFEQGESLLRTIRDPLSIAKLLCEKGCLYAAIGRVDEARGALAEAQDSAARIGARPGSDLQCRIERLAEVLRPFGS